MGSLHWLPLLCATTVYNPCPQHALILPLPDIGHRMDIVAILIFSGFAIGFILIAAEDFV